MKYILMSLILSSLYGSNVFAGINYIEYSQKYSQQNQKTALETIDQSCCPYCD